MMTKLPNGRGPEHHAGAPCENPSLLRVRNFVASAARSVASPRAVVALRWALAPLFCHAPWYAELVGGAFLGLVRDLFFSGSANSSPRGGLTRRSGLELSVDA